MGLYWIAGSVVRTIQQIIINKQIDKMDFDKLIEKNAEKSAKKLVKAQEQQKLMEAYANMNTKKIQSKATSYNNGSDAATGETVARKAKPGSMMEKANMVSEYNKRNNK